MDLNNNSVGVNALAKTLFSFSLKCRRIKNRNRVKKIIIDNYHGDDWRECFIQYRQFVRNCNSVRFIDLFVNEDLFCLGL